MGRKNEEQLLEQIKVLTAEKQELSEKYEALLNADTVEKAKYDELLVEYEELKDKYETAIKFIEQKFGKEAIKEEDVKVQKERTKSKNRHTLRQNLKV